MIRLDLKHPALQLGIVYATGVRCEASGLRLVEQMIAAETGVRANPDAFPESVRTAVRDMLRCGGYKPTGRGKPASEYLVGAAREQGLPRVNNLVDSNNLVSLKSALPISIFDTDLLTDDVVIRFGRTGERYAFNASGQVMDIEGIPVVCRGATDESVGNAVKDSMLAKVGPHTSNVTAVIYGSQRLPNGYVAAAARQLADLLVECASATECQHKVIPE